MADFLPRANATLKTWLANFKIKFGAVAATLGLSSEVATSDTNCDTLVQEINLVTQKKNEWKAAAQAAETSKKDKTDWFRALIRRIKSAPGYLQSMGQDMGIIGEEEGLDLTTYKPGISGQAYKGYNQINFEKGHVDIDGVHVYARMKGTVEWGNKIAYDTNSPYPHHGILQGQTWEYQLVGVIDDFEVGLPSLVVELTAI